LALVPPDARKRAIAEMAKRLKYHPDGGTFHIEVYNLKRLTSTLKIKAIEASTQSLLVTIGFLAKASRKSMIPQQ